MISSTVLCIQHKAFCVETLQYSSYFLCQISENIMLGQWWAYQGVLPRKKVKYHIFGPSLVWLLIKVW